MHRFILLILIFSIPFHTNGSSFDFDWFYIPSRDQIAAFVLTDAGCPAALISLNKVDAWDRPDFRKIYISYLKFMRDQMQSQRSIMGERRKISWRLLRNKLSPNKLQKDILDSFQNQNGDIPHQLSKAILDTVKDNPLVQFENDESLQGTLTVMGYPLYLLKTVGASLTSYRDQVDIEDFQPELTLDRDQKAKALKNLRIFFEARDQDILSYLDREISFSRSREVIKFAKFLEAALANFPKITQFIDRLAPDFSFSKDYGASIRFDTSISFPALALTAFVDEWISRIVFLDSRRSKLKIFKVSEDGEAEEFLFIFPGFQIVLKTIRNVPNDMKLLFLESHTLKDRFGKKENNFQQAEVFVEAAPKAIKTYYQISNDLKDNLDETLDKNLNDFLKLISGWEIKLPVDEAYFVGALELVSDHFSHLLASKESWASILSAIARLRPTSNADDMNERIESLRSALFEISKSLDLEILESQKDNKYILEKIRDGELSVDILNANQTYEFVFRRESERGIQKVVFSKAVIKYLKDRKILAQRLLGLFIRGRTRLEGTNGLKRLVSQTDLPYSHAIKLVGASIHGDDRIGINLRAGIWHIEGIFDPH